ncbi:hypothetical protein C0J52_10998, partial [Blattella germanica]
LKDLIEWRSIKEQANASSSVPGSTVPGQDNELSQQDVYVFLPLKVWLAREGFARLSGSQFSLDTLGDNKVHSYKWSMRQLREYMAARHGVQTVENLIQRIANVVLISLHSVEPVIMHNRHCFELYGYDILLDSDLRPWLLEVNASPSMSATDNDDYQLKYNMLTDLLSILDLEGRLKGTERRIGGFDLIWDNGPIWAACPGGLDCFEQMHFTSGRNIYLSQRLNTYLGKFAMSSYNYRIRIKLPILFHTVSHFSTLRSYKKAYKSKYQRS